MADGGMNAMTHDMQTPASVLVLSDDVPLAEWDAFVSRSEAASAFHRSAWIDAVSRATDHRAHRLGVRDSGGALVGVLPLHHVTSPLFGSALVSSGFAVGGGIVADDPAAAALLADGAVALARSLKVATVELRGGPVPDAPGWTKTTGVYSGFESMLAEDDDAQLTAIPRKQRAEVRKALAGDLTVRTGCGAQDRSDHYAVYAASVRNLGTPVFPRALFDAVLDGFGAAADILTVYDGVRPVASVLSLYHGGAVMPYWGGGTADARQSRANERMYFALMLHARMRGCTRFDFGRSKLGTGPHAYKKNWGFEPQPLSYAVWTADGAPPRDINPTSAKYRMQVALWKRMPLPLANMLGPWIAKGLG
jgi:FemAB-related protein (PEP-CTERM system-associated)